MVYNSAKNYTLYWQLPVANIKVIEECQSTKNTMFSTKAVTFSHSKSFEIQSRKLKIKNNYTIAK